MIYGDDVTHIVTEEGIANLLLCREPRRARAGDPRCGGLHRCRPRPRPQGRSKRLRERGVIHRPEDLGIDPLDADRSLLAARSIKDLVHWSGRALRAAIAASATGEGAAPMETLTIHLRRRGRAAWFSARMAISRRRRDRAISRCWPNASSRPSACHLEIEHRHRMVRPGLASRRPRFRGAAIAGRRPLLDQRRRRAARRRVAPPCPGRPPHRGGSAMSASARPAAGQPCRRGQRAGTRPQRAPAPRSPARSRQLHRVPGAAGPRRAARTWRCSISRTSSTTASPSGMGTTRRSADVLVAAQEGRFMGGAFGEVHGAKLTGLVCGGARSGKSTPVLILFDTGGVRLQEANAGELAIARDHARRRSRRVWPACSSCRPRSAAAPAATAAAASSLACCSALVVSEQGRIAVSGPEVIETNRGVEEFDSRDHALVWRTMGGKHRRLIGGAEFFVDDTVQDFRDAALALLGSVALFTVATLRAEQERLEDRLRRFGALRRMPSRSGRRRACRTPGRYRQCPQTPSSPSRTS